MPVNLKILLIEDKVNDVEMIKRRFNETVEWLRDKSFLCEMKFDTVFIEHIKGTVKKRHKEEQHFYYSDAVVAIVQDALENIELGEKICILTDVLLTKEDDEKARVNNFDEISLVKKICDSFEDSYPMYFITSISSFGSRVWRIFGREHLVNCYIQKDVVDLPSKKGIAEALYWLSNKELMPREFAEKIEKKELEDFIY